MNTINRGKFVGYRVIAECAKHTDSAGYRQVTEFSSLDDCRIGAWEVASGSTRGNGGMLCAWVIAQVATMGELGQLQWHTIEVINLGGYGDRVVSSLYSSGGIAFDLDNIAEQPQQLTCARCGEIIPPKSAGSFASNYYGVDASGNKHCYACCAEIDREFMRTHDRITLYLSIPPIWQVAQSTVREVWRKGGGSRTIPRDNVKISNWPNSLEIKPSGLTWGVHNWGLARYDVWFTFEGSQWHGIKIGNDTDLVHCRKLKQPPPPKERAHYVGMAGLRGYMPSYTTVGETRGSVAEDLGSLHELSGRAIKRLRRDNWIDLDLYEHGNEYCSIDVCECGKSFEECCAELEGM